MSNESKGTLYGIGVGPGDPKLMTLRAVEVLKKAEIVFAASSPKNNYSRALDTAKSFLPPSAEVRMMDFPMTKDQDALHQAWEVNAREVLEVLEEGRDAAFLTIGDSLTYSTYGYLLLTLLSMAPDSKVESVPGITSYQAAASRLNLPLVEAKESLMVVSGVNDPAEIPELAACADNLVIMKTYRNYDQILDALDELPEKRRTYCVSDCCGPNEQVHHDAHALRGQKMPYLSLIIAKSTIGE